ncbi:MAG: hypothetical protein H0X24_15175 [Ktedonobacterales bacterium]|nr:hypothetical protein [Ktedonobacterales bacterium]
MLIPSHVYHMAEAANWPAIQRDGLYSASALLDRAGLVGPARAGWERCQRLVLTTLPTGAQLRDQRPMPPAALEKCLVGLTPDEWYALLNARIFFWLDPERLNRHRRACEPSAQVVMTLDAERLLAAYGERTALSPINTGNARRLPAKRGAATFVAYTTWVASRWASEAAALGTRLRPPSHAPVELTVVGAVPDVMTFVVDVQELAPGQSFTPPSR